MRLRPLRFASFFAILATLLSRTAAACTPVVPLTAVFFGGPSMVALQYGGVAMLLVVILKCSIYARLSGGESQLGSWLAMFLANILSTIAGMLVLAPFSVPSAPAFLVVPLLLCLWAARTLARVTDEAAPIALGKWEWFGVLAGSFIGCFIAYGHSQALLSSHLDMFMVSYWFTKWVALTLTVVFSLALTCALELAVVTSPRMDAKQLHARGKAVLLANLWTFFAVCTAGAILMLPHRLRSATGLVGESVLR